MSMTDLPDDSEAGSSSDLQAAEPHRSGASLQVRYEHHKARHQHYKKAYRHLKKYRWISLGALVVAFTTGFSLMAILPTYSQLQDDYEGVLVDVKISEDQNLLLKEALLAERKHNFELNKEAHPELRIFAFNTLIATDQQNVRSAFFEATDKIGKHVDVNYQLLVAGPIEQDLFLVLIDQTGEEVHQQAIDFGNTPPQQDESLTLEGALSLDKDIDVRYFRVKQLTPDN
ncbi:hypothetical protein ACVFI8_12360 [Agarivorans sp. MS3-6]|uniref:hypothetical protein n=1 Tax=Agarivorans sp. TSD2052 TaxID=2937286 RepID=UPI00200E277A|nr:hypothetical protein [Agarivorans sp. TSD2052]UPW18238.1 hypothetical protein M0C34_18750 [Agarivorans sp. TSD2052]